MKKNRSSKNISHICEKLRQDFEDWSDIPEEEPKDDKKEREVLYEEIKKKMKDLNG